ncbi:MAG TPA: methionyl-tRNA formyltransferase [Lachnospiraceae bacterium]|nr:methionyl-tRNA formyltransferase [Lachnospiraceae bacterium]
MKIVFMGTPDFAVGALRALIQAGHEIVAVVTQPDKAKGRSDKLIFSPVKECAVEAGIPVLQPVRIKRSEAVAELKQYPADIFVVAAFGQILSKEILDMPRLGCLNIHASLLPKYRGSSPIQWTVINGEEKTGITIQQMNEGIDTGDILYQKEIFLSERETGASLFEKLSELGAQAIVEALLLLEKGELNPVSQKEEEATHTVMLDKSMGLIDWKQSAVKIERLIRGLNSWPSAYTAFAGKQLKIWEASIVDNMQVSQIQKKQDGMLPGMVTKSDKSHLYVACGEGILAVDSVQLEGKKRMSTHDFLLGNTVTEGTILG